MALVIHLHVHPFKTDLDNNLQANALLAIVVTVFYAIFSKLRKITTVSSGDTVSTENMAVLDTLVIVLNVFVLVSTFSSFLLMTVSAACSSCVLSCVCVLF